MTLPCQSSVGARWVIRLVLLGLVPPVVAVTPQNRLQRILRVSGVRDRQLAEQEPGPRRADFSHVLARLAQARHPVLPVCNDDPGRLPPRNPFVRWSRRKRGKADVRPLNRLLRGAAGAIPGGRRLDGLRAALAAPGTTVAFAFHSGFRACLLSSPESVPRHYPSLTSRPSAGFARASRSRANAPSDRDPATPIRAGDRHHSRCRSSSRRNRQGHFLAHVFGSLP
jgi:hypothetical protein